MSDIRVQSVTQRLILDPATQSISIVNAGPVGPPGFGGDGGGGSDIVVLDEDTFVSNSPVNPPSQQSTKAFILSLGYQTSTQVNALIMASSASITITYSGTWPSAAGIPSGKTVLWIQPNVAGSAPPAGGRPGRAPGDLVFIRQS